MEGEEADPYKDQEQSKCPKTVRRVEDMFHLYHEDLAHETEHVDREEHHEGSEQLDMCDLVMGIQFKYEHVVDPEASEDHDIDPHEEQHKDKTECEAEDSRLKDNFFPVDEVVAGVLMRKQNCEERYDACYDECASKESQENSVHLSHLDTLLHELLLSSGHVPPSKNGRVDTEDLLKDNFHVFAAGEGLVVNVGLELLVQDVVLQSEVAFHELRLGFLKCDIVDLGVGVEPFEADEELLEGAAPVRGEFKLIFDLAHALVFHLRRLL